MPSTDASSPTEDQDGSGGGASGGEAPFSYVPPQIVDVYLVSPASLPLMSTAGKKKNEALTASAVRQVVVDYVKENNLQDQVDKTLVRLDPPLCDAALDRGEYVETLKWEELQSRILTRMIRGYEITSSAGGRPEVRKGAPEPIRLDVVQRGSNKKVTCVHNLELYGIDPTEFAAFIQHGVACSASVSAELGKNKGNQVSAQGNQVNYIASLLTEKYKLPARYIAGLEKAPKTKKK